MGTGPRPEERCRRTLALLPSGQSRQAPLRAARTQGRAAILRSLRMHQHRPPAAQPPLPLAVRSQAAARQVRSSCNAAALFSCRTAAARLLA